MLVYQKVSFAIYYESSQQRLVVWSDGAIPLLVMIIGMIQWDMESEEPS